MIGARLLFIIWLTKHTFSKRTQFLLLYSLFTIPKNYLLPAKRKVSYMSGKVSMSVLYWIFSNHLQSYFIHCKRRGMQQLHLFLNCCHVEKMTHVIVTVLVIKYVCARIDSFCNDYVIVIVLIIKYNLCACIVSFCSDYGRVIVTVITTNLCTSIVSICNDYWISQLENCCWTLSWWIVLFVTFQSLGFFC